MQHIWCITHIRWKWRTSRGRIFSTVLRDVIDSISVATSKYDAAMCRTPDLRGQDQLFPLKFIGWKNIKAYLQYYHDGAGLKSRNRHILIYNLAFKPIRMVYADSCEDISQWCSGLCFGVPMHLRLYLVTQKTEPTLPEYIFTSILCIWLVFGYSIGCEGDNLY